MSLLDTVFDRAFASVDIFLRHAFAPVAPYLRRLVKGLGAAVLLIWSVAWVLFGLSLALFFAIAGLPYVAAALWVTLAWAILAVFLALVAALLIRPPRR